jgi:hypothetical protein
MKFFILSLFLLFTCGFSYAQDTIIQKNGATIPAKVLEIDKSNVRYKKFDNPEGPSYVISKDDVSLIRYRNGTVDSFSVVTPRPKYFSQPLSEMYLKGEKDAQTYYTKYKPAARWTLGLTIPLNALSIFPVVAIASGTPPKHRLDYPDEKLISNADYYNGYLKGTKSKKNRYVMKNFIIGGIASLVLYGSLLLAIK